MKTSKLVVREASRAGLTNGVASYVRTESVCAGIRADGLLRMIRVFRTGSGEGSIGLCQFSIGSDWSLSFWE